MQWMHPRVCWREFFVSKTINRTRDNYLKESSFLSNLSLFVVNSFPKNSRAFYVNSSTLKNLNKLNTHRKTRLKNTNTTFDFKDLWYNSRPEINLLFRFITVDEYWPVNNYWLNHDQCLQIYLVLFLLLVETLTNVSLMVGQESIMSNRIKANA